MQMMPKTFRCALLAVCFIFLPADLKAVQGVTPYHADLSGNTIVDFSDFAELARDWGKAGSGLQGDLNSDQVVDFNDLHALASNWQSTWIPISTAEDLQAIDNDYQACYVLVNDIDARATATWNGGRGFNPVGNWSFFAGSLIGNGHSIQGLHIDRPSQMRIGLFARLESSAKISDVRLTDVFVRGESLVGALVGEALGARISRVSSTGVVEAVDQAAGGIAGQMYPGRIVDSFSECNVVADSAVGGIAGQLLGGAIAERCYSTGDVAGGYHSIGGLAGHFADAIIADCYSVSGVSGPFLKGGLVGNVMGGSWVISRSYYTDSVYIAGFGTFEPAGPAAFVGTAHQHPVYLYWDFDNIWSAHSDRFPTLNL